MGDSQVDCFPRSIQNHCTKMVEFTNPVSHQRIQRRYDECDASPLQWTLCGVHEVSRWNTRDFPNPVGKTPKTSFLKRTKASIICFCSGFNRNWESLPAFVRAKSKAPSSKAAVSDVKSMRCKAKIARSQSFPELTRRKQRKQWGRECRNLGFASHLQSQVIDSWQRLCQQIGILSAHTSDEMD